MNENQRVLDLDAVKTIPVRIGGREFLLTQQRRAVLQRVVERIFQQDDKALPDKAQDSEYLRVSFQRWEDSFPTIALILGYEEEDSQTAEVVAHLREHLSFPGASKLFQEWWKLNQVDRFLGRAGDPLIPEEIVSGALEQAAAEPVLN